MPGGRESLLRVNSDESSRQLELPLSKKAAVNQGGLRGGKELVLRAIRSAQSQPAKL